MPPRKQKTIAKATAQAGADDDADLDALLEAAIRENQGIPGSPAALRLQQQQREARERGEREQREAREMAEAEAEAAQCICGACGAGQAKKKCGACEQVRYCSEQCQVAHWPAHKARCRVLRAEAAVVAAEAEVEAVRREREQQEEEEVVHNPDTEAGNCWTCGADNPRNVCNRCKVTKYCGVACQTGNWPIHKGRCAMLKEQYAIADQMKSDLRKFKGGARKSQEQLNRDLTYASMLGRIVDIERIIAAGGNVNASSSTGLCVAVAAQEGHARAIGVLVRHGAQVDARDQKGIVAIHIAAQHGQLKAVAALMEHGAQVDARNFEGRNALHFASHHNHPEVVALLLEHGAKIDQRDNVGNSPLYVASEGNNPEVVALLLEKGAQVELPRFGLSDCNRNNGGSGVTPLGISTAHGHTACVRLLLQAGADPLRRLFCNKTTLDIAIRQNHTDIVALLRAHIDERIAGDSDDKDDDDDEDEDEDGEEDDEDEDDDEEDCARP